MKMKRVLILSTICLASTGLFAQNSTTPKPAAKAPDAPVPAISSKKGEMFLPQAGDWAISLDATPWLNYLGNLLSSHGNVAPSSSFVNSNQTFVWKYYTDNHTAYRVLARIGFNSYSQNQEINSSDTSTSFPKVQVLDNRHISNHFIGLGFGIEKRKGKTRLQGYYGAEFMFYISGSDTTFTYGNAYNANSNTQPGWYDWTSGTTVNGLPRTTQNGPGGTFGINLVAFLGAEYFIMPKIAIGGEFTWGILFHTTAKGSYAVEELNTVSGKDQIDTYKSGGNTTFSFDNGINQAFGSGTGSIYVTLHF